jgi:hypothetical protein
LVTRSFFRFEISANAEGLDDEKLAQVAAEVISFVAVQLHCIDPGPRGKTYGIFSFFFINNDADCEYFRRQLVHYAACFIRSNIPRAA